MVLEGLGFRVFRAFGSFEPQGFMRLWAFQKFEVLKISGLGLLQLRVSIAHMCSFLN